MSTHYLPLSLTVRIVEAQVGEPELWAGAWELWLFLGLLGWEEKGGWMELCVPGVLRPCGGDSGNW